MRSRSGTPGPTTSRPPASVQVLCRVEPLAAGRVAPAHASSRSASPAGRGAGERLTAREQRLNARNHRSPAVIGSGQGARRHPRDGAPGEQRQAEE